MYYSHHEEGRIMRNSVRLVDVGCSPVECREAHTKALLFLAKVHSNIISFPENEHEIGQGPYSRFMGKVKESLLSSQ